MRRSLWNLSKKWGYIVIFLGYIFKKVVVRREIWEAKIGIQYWNKNLKRRSLETGIGEGVDVNFTGREGVLGENIQG